MPSNQAAIRSLVVLLYLVAFIPMGWSPVEYDKFNTLLWHQEEVAWDAIFSIFSLLGIVCSWFFLRRDRWRIGLVAFGVYWFLTSVVPLAFGALSPIAKMDEELTLFPPYWLLDFSDTAPRDIINGLGVLAWLYFTRFIFSAILGVVLAIIVVVPFRPEVIEQNA